MVCIQGQRQLGQVACSSVTPIQCPVQPQRFITQVCGAEVSCRVHIPNSHPTEQLQDKKFFCMGLQDGTGEGLTVPPMKV